MTGENAGTVTSTDGVNTTFTNIESIAGTRLADDFTGGAFGDSFSGGEGADDYAGDDGEDHVAFVLDAIGGALAGATVNLATGTGTDPFGDADTFDSIENLTGTNFADNFTGDGEANRFVTLGGNDTLNGGDGVDELDGGAGNDTYILNADTTDILTDVSGIDTIVSTITRTLAAAFEHLTLLGGSANIDGTGNGSANTLTGNSGKNTLNGLDGNDILIGGVGIDILNGGNDNDTLRIAGTEANGDTFSGGLGIDKIQVIGAAAVTLAGFSKTNGIEQWQGNSKGVFGTAAVNNFDFSSLTSATGWTSINTGAGNDTIVGTKFKDTIIGGAGKDIITGGLLGDIFDFNATSESVRGVNRDQLKGFNRAQGDKIDLRDIDADTSANPGNDVFKFIGTKAFSGGGGEIRLSGTTLQIDVNGGVADMEISIFTANIKSTDFFL
jgi:Ca2+-binding RTX toxin-like protein